MIEEAKSKVMKEAPPAILLRLVSVHTFANGQKVALYFCEQIKKYFSFTYDKDGILCEEEVIENSFDITQLKDINEIRTISFEDASTLNIDEECASKVLDLYDNISEGKEEFLDYIKQSDSNFLRILDYSLNNFKKEL